jgi:hypothetical protein
LKEHFIGEKIMEKFSKERIAELRKEPWVFGAYIIHQRYNDALSEIERLQRERPIPCGDVLDVTAIRKMNASLRELVGELAMAVEYWFNRWQKHLDASDQSISGKDSLLSRAKEVLNNGKT